MLRYATLMLRYATLCYAMLRYATLCYAMLHVLLRSTAVHQLLHALHFAPHDGMLLLMVERYATLCYMLHCAAQQYISCCSRCTSRLTTACCC